MEKKKNHDQFFGFYYDDPVPRPIAYKLWATGKCATKYARNPEQRSSSDLPT